MLFWWSPQGFLYRVSSLLQSVTILLLPFQFELLVFIYFCLWLGLSVLHWIKAVKVGIFVLFLMLEGMLSAFHHRVWCWLCLGHICLLLHWDMFSLYPLCWEFLIINECWILSNVSFCIHWDNHITFIPFYSLYSCIWCITLINLQILNNPCSPGVNPTWS